MRLLVRLLLLLALTNLIPTAATSTPATPTVTPVPGVHYDDSFSYDQLGNLINKDGVLQQYGSNNNGTRPRPHAARVVGGQTYTYDNNGNLMSGGGRTYTDLPLQGCYAFDEQISMVQSIIGRG